MADRPVAEQLVEDPVRRSAIWTRSGTPAEALGVLKEYARSHNGRIIEENGSELTLRFGSRLGWRLLGTWAPRCAPYVVRVSTASQGAESKLTADAYSDPGFYVSDLPWYWFPKAPAMNIFATRLSETLAELQGQ